MIIEGVMSGNLPWALIFMGMAVSVAVELLGISSLAFAIGLYLPLQTTLAVFVGGVLRLITDKMTKAEEDDIGNGILYASGLIAGEGLVGILLAVFAVSHIDQHIDLSGVLDLGQIGGVVLFLVMSGTVIAAACKGMKKRGVQEEGNSREGTR